MTKNFDAARTLKTTLDGLQSLIVPTVATTTASPVARKTTCDPVDTFGGFRCGA